MMDAKKNPLKILFVTYLCSGPMNQSIGLAHLLKQHGHDISFVLNRQWKGKLSSFGFHEYFLDSDDVEETSSSNDDFWKNYVEQSLPKFRQSTFEQIESYFRPIWKTLIDEGKLYEVYLEKLFRGNQFDLIVQDHNIYFPIFERYSIPWIRFVSCNPLEIPGENLPPTYSGLSSIDRIDWTKYRDEYQRVIFPIWKEFQQWVEERSSSSSLKHLQFNVESKYGNFYLYPLEADYTNERPLNDRWFRIDSSIRQTDEKFQLPERFLHRPSSSSLIYLSLGTLASADVQLMRRLIDLLDRTSHFCIISKGSFGQDLKLNERMIGDCSLPQTKILPLVDLVITHGGNNTITETLHFGKPMIILPIFWDQYDNAQRMDDLKFGRRFNTYSFDDDEFLQTIEQFLHDENFKMKMNQIGEKIRQRQGLQFAVKTIEEIGEKYRNSTSF